MYKVFIKEHLLCFSEKEKNIERDIQVKHIVYPSKEDYRSVVESLLKQQKRQVIHFQLKELQKGFERFCDTFQVIKAAGGLVKNNKKDLLFIYRLGKWDLPKGKVEKGESIEAAAVREVEEECGVSALEIVKKLENTYHIYRLGGAIILKETHWFLMKSHYQDKLIPQVEEEITVVSWVNPENMEAQMENTYPSIRDLLQGNLQF